MKRIFFILFCLALLGSGCGQQTTQLEQILDRGELRVLSRYSLTSYYLKDKTIPAGLEYELANRFAQRLGVKLKMIVPENLADMLRLLEQGQADIAAAGLTKTPQRKQQVRFSPVYHEVTPQLVYKLGTGKPEDMADLEKGQLEVLAGSSHVEKLKSLQHEFPDLSWRENNELASNDLLELVQLELIDYTVIDSDEMAANQTLYPELRVAFNISDPQPVAWAMALSKNNDNSLYDAVTAFFHDLEGSGELDKLIEKYYGYIQRFDYVDTRAFHRRIQTHLPNYETLFKKAAKKYDFRWQLLAAIAYQESHWNPNAVSNTGVKGIMMLTKAAAQDMEIDDRKDPKQSIFAGAGYLASLYQRLPDSIPSPDRLWFALAAYNIGYGHLLDARTITKQRKKNPDTWADVRESLPLLAKKEWFEHTKYGFARGKEPVRYVQNIRRYLNILLHLDDRLAPIESPDDTNTVELPPAAL